MSQQDDLLALALARGSTFAAAAKSSGYSERTVRRRMESEDFRAKVQKIKDDVLTRTVSYMSASGVEAAKQLRRLAKNATKDGDKIRACVAIITLGSRLRELSELAERIASIEERLK